MDIPVLEPRCGRCGKSQQYADCVGVTPLAVPDAEYHGYAGDNGASRLHLFQSMSIPPGWATACATLAIADSAVSPLAEASSTAMLSASPCGGAGAPGCLGKLLLMHTPASRAARPSGSPLGG